MRWPMCRATPATTSNDAPERRGQHRGRLRAEDPPAVRHARRHGDGEHPPACRHPAFRRPQRELDRGIRRRKRQRLRRVLQRDRSAGRARQRRGGRGRRQPGRAARKRGRTPRGRGAHRLLRRQRPVDRRAQNRQRGPEPHQPGTAAGGRLLQAAERHRERRYGRRHPQEPFADRHRREQGQLDGHGHRRRRQLLHLPVRGDGQHGRRDHGARTDGRRLPN
jgi:hypothetical protein